MDSNNFNTLQKQFEKKLNQYEKLLAKVKKYPDYGISEDDNILEIEEYSESLGVRENILRGIREIKRAIKAIRKGKYGICSNCKLKINPERLKIYPAATHCVKCKSQQSNKRPWLKFPWRRG